MSLQLVIDASVAVRLALEEGDFALLARGHRLSAPALLWSETVSVLHEMRWRQEISVHLAELALRRLRKAPVARHTDVDEVLRASLVADALGWAKTYDAEYVALAERLDCPLVTLDARLHRGASRRVAVRTPAELGHST